MIKNMKKVHLLPNVITAFGLSCGLFAIFKINMMDAGSVNYQSLIAVSGILLLAAVADLLDGAVARAMKAESEFGGLFDSLADAITFGVGPSIIILKTLSIVPGTELSFFLTAAAMIYTVCGVLRLVRFSLTAQQAKGNQDLTDAHKKNFTGLPIPGAAAAAVSANLFLISDEFKRFVTIDETLKAWIMIVGLVVIGYCMISRWKFPSFKTLHIRVRSFQMVFLTVVSAVVLFYGILHYFALLFLICSWGYILVAAILSLIRLISGKKSKTLEDFEPEPDDDLDNE
jgi:CDP-diacylglycerol--serine O-phosphatidyltransferase